MANFNEAAFGIVLSLGFLFLSLFEIDELDNKVGNAPNRYLLGIAVVLQYVFTLVGWAVCPYWWIVLLISSFLIAAIIDRYYRNPRLAKINN